MCDVILSLFSLHLVSYYTYYVYSNVIIIHMTICHLFQWVRFDIFKLKYKKENNNILLIIVDQFYCLLYIFKNNN